MRRARTIVLPHQSEAACVLCLIEPFPERLQPRGQLSFYPVEHSEAVRDLPHDNAPQFHIVWPLTVICHSARVPGPEKSNRTIAAEIDVVESAVRRECESQRRFFARRLTCRLFYSGFASTGR